MARKKKANVQYFQAEFARAHACCAGILSSFILKLGFGRYMTIVVKIFLIAKYLQILT